MKRAVVIVIGLLVVVLAAVSVGAAVLPNEAVVPDDTAVRDELARQRAVASVDERVDKIITGFNFEESIRVASPLDAVSSISREDLTRMVRAEQLRDLGEPM